MIAQEFEEQFRRFMRAKPFRPFDLFMEDGRIVTVDRPKAAVAVGGAGFKDSDGQLQLIECEQVREIKPAREEMAR